MARLRQVAYWRESVTDAGDHNMLKFLKRWLGWDSDSGPFEFGDVRIGPGRSTSAPQSPPRPPPTPRRETQTTQTTQARSPPPQPPGQPKNAAQKKPPTERAPIDVLDNPQLTLDRPTDDGFDPYNTGAFNRSASWERIGRHKR